MAETGNWIALQNFIRTEWDHLATIHASDRPWQMPFAAALAMGLPLLIGAWFDRMDFGLTSSLGGLAFLYLPKTPMYHRMVTLMACAFGVCACYTLGVMTQALALAAIPVMIFITIVVTMVCRFYNVGPPGILFFVMAASIGAYSPVAAPQLPQMAGLIFMGALLACLIAFFYSLVILRLRTPQPVAPLPQPTFDFVVFDAVAIGVFVGISLALAAALQLDRPYWVPVTCIAVIQEASLRAVWNKQLHRIAGTVVGLLVAWGILVLPLEKWSIALTMMALTFIIEIMVVRHYGLANVFVTPLAILLAEAATLGQTSHATLIQSRFFDTVLGCLVGLAGGACLHNARFRDVVGRALRRLIPSRLLLKSNDPVEGESR